MITQFLLKISLMNINADKNVFELEVDAMLIIIR